MFEPLAGTEVNIPQDLRTWVDQAWTSVISHGETPWIHVFFTMHFDDGGKLSHSLLTYGLDGIINFQEQEDITIDAVHFVTPGNMNGTGCWQIESVEEIRQAPMHGKRGKSQCVVCCESGKRYGFPANSMQTKGKGGEELALIYRKPTVTNRAMKQMDS